MVLWAELRRERKNRTPSGSEVNLQFARDIEHESGRAGTAFATPTGIAATASIATPTVANAMSAAVMHAATNATATIYTATSSTTSIPTPATTTLLLLLLLIVCRHAIVIVLSAFMASLRSACASWCPRHANEHCCHSQNYLYVNRITLTPIAVREVHFDCEV